MVSFFLLRIQFSLVSQDVGYLLCCLWLHLNLVQFTKSLDYLSHIFTHVNWENFLLMFTFNFILKKLCSSPLFVVKSAKHWVIPPIWILESTTFGSLYYNVQRKSKNHTVITQINIICQNFTRKRLKAVYICVFIFKERLHKSEVQFCCRLCRKFFLWEQKLMLWLVSSSWWRMKDMEV